MLQNVVWCQITWSKCMLCNILKYCPQALDIHGQRALQLILFFIYDFIIIENMLLNVFLQ